jgi:hypothetical protein
MGLALLIVAVLGFGAFKYFGSRFQTAGSHATPRPSAEDAKWVNASGDAVTPGVTLFYGPNKVRTGEVVSTDAESVTVELAGSPERLERKKVAELYFIRADDPKLHR